MMRKTLLFILLIAVISCKQSSQKPTIDETKRGYISQNAMVVSAREEASKIGAEIMKKGGNAFDAMVATELALAVSFPYAGNIGGGGFMVYRKANGETGTLDYREKAPLAATSNMYLDANGDVIEGLSIYGATAVGVPGTIAGVFEVHKKLGSMPIAEIMQPVIDLAHRGVVVTTKQENRIKKYQDLFKKVNNDSIKFMHEWKVGDTIKYPNLARTLERIQKNGRDEFYRGETAQKLAAFIQENGGIITVEDLNKYEPQWRDPITFQYDELTVTSMAPPSSGGICMAQIMKMIEPFDLHQYGHNSLETVKVMVEAERRAYADRSFFLGDPDFVDIPLEQLMEDDYLKNRMLDFSFDQPTSSSAVSYGSVELIESNETTHYAIVDAEGNAVSVTTTINGAYGGKLYCSELGFFLNNEMDDLSAKPGEPNMFGLIGAEANRIEPEKRPLSSMTPTIVEKDGALHMVVGTRGGSTIITSVLQIILNVHEYNMTMQQAVDAPRFHHQWLPDVVQFEQNGFSKSFKRKVMASGYEVKDYTLPTLGNMCGILRLPDNSLEGGEDRRGDDTAVGF